MFESVVDRDGVALTGLLERGEHGAPGGALLDQLAGLDPGRLDTDAQLGLVVALERHAGWLAALTQRAMAALPRPRDGEDPSRDELACAVGISGRAADGRLDVARRLADRLPLVLTLMRGGELSLGHARVCDEETIQLPDDAAAAAVESVLCRPAGRPRTPGQLRAALRRAVLRTDPTAARARHEQAVAGRSVSFSPAGDGMAELLLRLPADAGLRAWTVIDALAGPHRADDPRRIDARRADAADEIFSRLLDGGALPTRQRRRPHLEIIIGWDTLIGLSEEPAELAGYGPIPAELARTLAGDADWRRLITDPVTGHLLDYGRTSYRPPAALRDYLIARDRTCRFPTCRQPAARSDLDHHQPWQAGGPTSAANLGATCRHHHRHKDGGGWRLHPHHDGALTWTSPSHRHYDVTPTPQPGHPPHHDRHPGRDPGRKPGRQPGGRQPSREPHHDRGPGREPNPDRDPGREPGPPPRPPPADADPGPPPQPPPAPPPTDADLGPPPF